MLTTKTSLDRRISDANRLPSKYKSRSLPSHQPFSGLGYGPGIKLQELANNMKTPSRHECQPRTSHIWIKSVIRFCVTLFNVFNPLTYKHGNPPKCTNELSYNKAYNHVYCNRVVTVLFLLPTAPRRRGDLVRVCGTWRHLGVPRFRPWRGRVADPGQMLSGRPTRVRAHLQQTRWKARRTEALLEPTQHLLVCPCTIDCTATWRTGLYEVR